MNKKYISYASDDFSMLRRAGRLILTTNSCGNGSLPYIAHQSPVRAIRCSQDHLREHVRLDAGTKSLVSLRANA